MNIKIKPVFILITFYGTSFQIINSTLKKQLPPTFFIIKSESYIRSNHNEHTHIRHRASNVNDIYDLPLQN